MQECDLDMATGARVRGGMEGQMAEGPPRPDRACPRVGPLPSGSRQVERCQAQPGLRLRWVSIIFLPFTLHTSEAHLGLKKFTNVCLFCISHFRTETSVGFGYKCGFSEGWIQTERCWSFRPTSKFTSLAVNKEFYGTSGNLGSLLAVMNRLLTIVTRRCGRLGPAQSKQQKREVRWAVAPR